MFYFLPSFIYFHSVSLVNKPNCSFRFIKLSRSVTSAIQCTYLSIICLLYYMYFLPSLLHFHSVLCVFSFIKIYILFVILNRSFSYFIYSVSFPFTIPTSPFSFMYIFFHKNLHSFRYIKSFTHTGMNFLSNVSYHTFPRCIKPPNLLPSYFHLISYEIHAILHRFHPPPHLSHPTSLTTHVKHLLFPPQIPACFQPTRPFIT